MCSHVLSHASCVQLFDPVDHNPSASSVHGVLQARIQEWVAMPSSRGSGIEPTSLMSPGRSSKTKSRREARPGVSLDFSSLSFGFFLYKMKVLALLPVLEINYSI